MDLEQAAVAASPKTETDEAGADEAARPRRRRKAKAPPAPATANAHEGSVASAPQPEPKPEAEAERPTPAPILSNATMPVAKAAPPAQAIAPRVSVLPPPGQRKAAASRPSFFRRHGALAAGIALALGLGAYAGTQIGIEHPGDNASAAETSVNVAAALPWKRDVAMASTQAREIARLKEDLRGLKTQLDVLKSNPDQARQAQEMRSLRASLETLKEGLSATRTDAANAIAQVSASASPKSGDRDQQKVEKIAERLDRLERQIVDSTPTATIAKAEPAKPVAAPDTHALPNPTEVAAAQRTEFRPKIIQNYVLREVADGVALIEGPDGLREVWPGRGVPGAGKVTSIERQAGKWVVITSEGVIEFKRDAYSRN
ncbi:MAG: hypothetical protein JOZ16_05310 [Methylobacteriaceae bacterium]|nr:hypothetical protein [Methylobacteriaceae bacterium]